MTYLEVLEQKSLEHEQSQQTDPAVDYPDSPRYVPKQSGEHKATQIEAGDLFDFDLEVEPLLEVLAGKTLDLAVMDVVDEIERAELVARRDQFEQMRNVELAETQRIEARETRMFEEKQRRKQQEKERVQREAELARKLAARTVSKATLEGQRQLHREARKSLSSLFATDLTGRILRQLQANGHFKDPVVSQISNDFLPWLVRETGDRVVVAASACKIVEAAVVDAVSGALETDLTIASARRAVLKQRHDEAVALQAERERAAAIASVESAPVFGADSATGDADPESNPVADPQAAVE